MYYGHLFWSCLCSHLLKRQLDWGLPGFLAFTVFPPPCPWSSRSHKRRCWEQIDLRLSPRPCCVRKEHSPFSKHTLCKCGIWLGILYMCTLHILSIRVETMDFAQSRRLLFSAKCWGFGCLGFCFFTRHKWNKSSTFITVGKELGRQICN